MKCLVINLDRSVDRLASATAQFSRIGIDFERVAGIDAMNGAPFTAPPLTETEVCCFLSHRRCWKTIAEGPDKYGAVFEDDVVFSQDAGGVLADDSWVPPDADIVKLETFLSRVRLGSRHIPVKNGYSARRLLGQHLGSCGYVISKSAAYGLLRNTERFRAAVDVALFSPNQMTAARNTVYQLMPALCAQAAVVGIEGPLSLIQLAPRPHVNKRMADRIHSEATRIFWYLRNRNFLSTEKVDAVRLGGPSVYPK
ncbi:glycosyl transferase [Mesorhizobium sp. WSM4308]|nr:glycosyl transferase [Mesorhizobium sp. WSM4304]PBB75715.1 glycosyl transferase [Mesorhizobium sp. WSM4308]